MHPIRLFKHLFKPCCTLAIIGVSLAGVSACKPSDQTPPATQAAASEAAGTAPADNMRGVIERLGTTADPHQLIIHHEPTKGMESMAMPFTVDDTVPLAGLAVGEKVAFRLETDPKTNADHVTRIDPLPSDTVLNLPATTTTATAPATNSMNGMPGM